MNDDGLIRIPMIPVHNPDGTVREWIPADSLAIEMLRGLHTWESEQERREWFAQHKEDLNQS